MNKRIHCTVPLPPSRWSRGEMLLSRERLVAEFPAGLTIVRHDAGSSSSGSSEVALVLRDSADSAQHAILYIDLDKDDQTK